MKREGAKQTFDKQVRLNNRFAVLKPPGLDEEEEEDNECRPCGFLGLGEENIGIFHVGKAENRKISIMIYSGAGESVMPCNMFDDYETIQTNKTGYRYQAANGGQITNLGEKRLNLALENGDTRGFQFQVTDKVTRPLGAVSRITSKGNIVHFEMGNSYIQNKSTGEKHWLEESKGVYLLEADVKPAQGAGKPYRRPGTH